MLRFLPVLLLTACRVELGPPGGVVADCEADAPHGEVWIYTSMYQEVVDALDPQIRALYPDVEPRWFRAGSEKVAQRAEAEWAAGGTKACLLMTSDPFWYVELDHQDRLRPHLPPNALQIDRSLVDPEAAWLTARISLMVMASHEDVPEADRPARFADLVEPRFRDRFSMGDPLASGTMFTTLAFLQDEQGWPFFERLRDNGMVAAGGNSSVLTRMETRERELGLVLLENLLAAEDNASPTEPVYPADGAIVVPGPIAITRDCPNPAAARAVYDFILSEDGQRAIVEQGDMYAALPDLPPPDGAPPLDELPTRPWPVGFVEQVVERKAALKDRYADLLSGG